jgi:hypothetical protein
MTADRISRQSGAIMDEPSNQPVPPMMPVAQKRHKPTAPEPSRRGI